MGAVTQPLENSESSDGRKIQSERTQPVFLLIESHSHNFQTRTVFSKVLEGVKRDLPLAAWLSDPNSVSDRTRN